MVQSLQRLTYSIDPQLRTPAYLRSKIIEATRTHPACQMGTGKPAPTVPGVINDIRTSISQYQDMNRTPAHNPATTNTNEAYYTDRRYYDRQRSPYEGQPPNRRPDRKPNRFRKDRGKARCIVCRKIGCWSTNHTLEERDAARQRAVNRHGKCFEQWLVDYENEDLEDAVEAYIQAINSSDSDDSEHIQSPASYFTEGPESYNAFGKALAEELGNRTAQHILGILPNVKEPDQIEAKTLTYESFVSAHRYSEAQFQGIMIDCGAASYSTAGYSQYIALRKAAKGVTLDLSMASTIEMKFGPGDPLRSVGHIDLTTPIGNVRFHVLEAATPFLLSLSDLDRLNVYFNNIRNILVGPKPGMTTLVVRRFGHPFIIWDYSFEMYVMQSLNENPCFLTDAELRRLHRRFGHPSTARLSQLLERAGHDPDNEALAKIRTICHHCQIHRKSPGRFRFTIRDNVNFNHSIIVDVMYIEGQAVLHIIDEATHYNAARWLSNLSAKTTWDTLRMAWIDSYLGPPDFIITDAGKNFISKEFSQLATSLGTTIVSVPVEAHWSIGAVE